MHNNTTSEDTYSSTLFTVIYTFILLITLFGCTLVLVLFYMERKNRKIAHNFVISMCFGDIMHGCVGSSVVIHYCNGLLLGDSTCHIETALMMATAYISLFNLVTTAIDRYLSIVYPLKYRVFMTHEASYVLIAIGWILGAGFGFGIIGLRSNMYLEKPSELCLYLTLVVDRVYLFAYIQLLIYAGVAITVIFYIRIYIELRRVVMLLNFVLSNLWKVKQTLFYDSFRQISVVAVSCLSYNGSEKNKNYRTKVGCSPSTLVSWKYARFG